MAHSYELVHRKPLHGSTKLESFYLRCPKCLSSLVVHAEPTTNPTVLEATFNHEDLSLEPCISIPKEFL